MMDSWVSKKHPVKGERDKMKRLILTSLIAVGAVMAQTGAPAAAPAAPKSQTQTTPKPAAKHHKKAKKSTAAPSTAQAPAKVSKVSK